MEHANAVRRISVLGFLGNVFLLIIKLAIGLTTGSQAMIADGLNSSGDVFSSIMTYIGNQISAKPDDSDHPYGHGKAEYIFSFIISFSFLFVAYIVFKNGVKGLIALQPVQYSIWLIVVAVTTLVIKTFLYVCASQTGKKYHSLLAAANAADHRNDLFITSLTLISIICSYFKIYYVDAVVGILISFWIGYTGFKVLIASYHVLMDRTLDDEIIHQMREQILAAEGVDHLDSIVARPIGEKFLILIKISVDGNLTVQAGHDISDTVKAAIMKFDQVADVLIHLNPAQTHPQRDYLK